MNASQPESLKSVARRCGLVFAAVVCGTLIMVGVSYAPLSNHGLVIGLVLAGACVNAFLVAGYLMHLISERRMIYALLVFTTLFFIGLMGLSIWAAHDLPGAGGHY
ncbi:MAG TPA: hypothetical protein VNT26_17750 [Candidatus Sulfotelmatobacter sp.]|nr:hypothetical protein [Candidatus Sulfotelmatobacter sp.]HWI59950.1 hypothetical protein [Bacillota bacterium]